MVATRIDMHHHVVPGFYRAWLASRGADAGGMPVPDWSLKDAAKQMRRTGVATAMLSVSTPGVSVGASRTDARLMAHELNQFCRELVVAEPGRFGYFATLPLPDLEGALAELNTAYDHLSADGVVLMTNTEGVYLGDPSLEPLMRELERRHSVVFVHPSALPGPTVPGIAPYHADFLLDTVRAAVNLARNGVLSRYPHIKFVLAHAGGFLPFAAGRLAPAASAKGNPIEGFRLLRRFYFDTALSGTPWALPSLLRFAPKGHVVHGSDYPYAPQLASLASAGFQALLRPSAAVSHLNARALFPRLVPVVPAIELPQPETLDAELVEEPWHRPDWELR